tara:strand:- start:74 stop:355 length:282 start_codon:yes stop_codon:yes gene_type:complete
MESKKDNEGLNIIGVKKENVKERGKIKKIKKIRCAYCKKKLGLIYFTCKCGNKYCQKHLNPHSHNCSFNNKESCQKQIEKNNPQMISSSFIKV